jgi:hypothetical protein
MGDAERKEMTIDCMRSAVQTAKDKKMGLPKDLIVRVFHSISRRI